MRPNRRSGTIARAVTHRLHLVALAVAFVVALPADGRAVPIRGTKLVVQGSAFSPKPARKSLFLAKEKSTDVDTLADPTVSGATLQITLTGATSTAQIYTLDAANWTAAANGYRYRTPTNPPELQVRIAKTPSGVASLKVMIKKDTIGLLAPSPGDEALLVLDVGAERYCVSFGGAAGGTEIKDTATQWKVNNATAEPACPPASSSLPPCGNEFLPCGSCGDGICVRHYSGSPDYVCASMSGYSAGTCASDGECAEPRTCMIPSTFPPGCPGGSGQCVVACNSDIVCEAESAGFCATVICIGQPCLLPCY